MANQIPLAKGTDAAGGVLVPQVVRDTLVKKFQRESAITQVVPVQRVSGNSSKFPVYMGQPTVSTVGEGAAKPVSGAEFSSTTIDIVKAATIVPYTDELLQDAAENPELLVNADVERAFAAYVDANALGLSAGTAITTAFNQAWGSTSTSVELGTGADALAVAVSSAMGTIEANGGRPTAIILASDMRAHLRDARNAGDLVGQPLYTQGFNREPDTLYGLPIVYTSNLDGLPAGAGKVAAFVADTSTSRLMVAQDITLTRSREAAVTIGGELVSAFENNLTLARWEMRLGFGVYDLNRMVVKIANAS